MFPIGGRFGGFREDEFDGATPSGFAKSPCKRSLPIASISADPVYSHNAAWFRHPPKAVRGDSRPTQVAHGVEPPTGAGDRCNGKVSPDTFEYGVGSRAWVSTMRRCDVLKQHSKPCCS